LAHVYRAGPAQRAGLSAGDIIVAADELRATAESLERVCTEYSPGDAVTLHAFRRDELLVATVVLDAAPHDTCWLEIDPVASDQALARRAGWLGTRSSV
jgi:predicted metalloprotease with PDZ domain